MPGTGAMNRLQELRNENLTNINLAKNPPLQVPKSAFKDLTNAAAKSLNVVGGKPGTLFRTPQVQNKKETKVKKNEPIQIFVDDFCTSLPQKHHEFAEIAWTAMDTDKALEKIDKPMKSECLDYELFKDDEFVLQHVPAPEPPTFLDLDFSLDDSLEIETPDIQPMKIEDLPDLDFSYFDFINSFDS